MFGGGACTTSRAVGVSRQNGEPQEALRLVFVKVKDVVGLGIIFWFSFGRGSGHIGWRILWWIGFPGRSTLVYLGVVRDGSHGVDEWSLGVEELLRCVGMSGCWLYLANKGKERGVYVPLPCGWSLFWYFFLFWRALLCSRERA